MSVFYERPIRGLELPDCQYCIANKDTIADGYRCKFDSRAKDKNRSFYAWRCSRLEELMCPRAITEQDVI